MVIACLCSTQFASGHLPLPVTHFCHRLRRSFTNPASKLYVLTDQLKRCAKSIVYANSISHSIGVKEMVDILNHRAEALAISGQVLF